MHVFAEFRDRHKYPPEPKHHHLHPARSHRYVAKLAKLPLQIRPRAFFGWIDTTATSGTPNDDNKDYDNHHHHHHNHNNKKKGQGEQFH